MPVAARQPCTGGEKDFRVRFRIFELGASAQKVKNSRSSSAAKIVGASGRQKPAQLESAVPGDLPAIVNARQHSINRQFAQ